MDALDALRRELPTAGVFLDFDGTLSPIVPRAADARPLPGLGQVLLDLTRRAGRLAVVSGRPISYLAQHLPDAIEMHGLYGIEARIDGEVRERGDAGRWRPVVDEVAAEALEAVGPSGVDVEHKGLSLTLHFRRAPDAQDAVSVWSREAAARSGLQVRTAKMSLELHPPVTVDKGTVVEERSEGLTAVAYVGDDVGDLPAFDALDRLAARGRAVVKVAVWTPDLSDELAAHADHQVDGPEGALALLRSLY